MLIGLFFHPETTRYLPEPGILFKATIPDQKE